MTTVIYIIFFLILPAICIFFRLRKKINTGFTLSGIFTSFLLGIIVAGTFLQKPSDLFIQYMNQNEYEKAKIELKLMLQSNPEELEKVSKKSLKNPILFRRIKQELENEYLNIVNKYLKDDNRLLIDTRTECENIQKEISRLGKFENALRLLKIAEIIGNNQEKNKKILENKIIIGEKALLSIRERCN